MRPVRWLTSMCVAALLAACAGVGTGPAPEARQALAPTGKLRMGLQVGNVLNVTRDPVTGEMKGIAFDMGQELARRLGVPFEPVLYPSIAALQEGGKSGAWDVAHFGFSPERAKDWDFAPVHLEVEFGYLVAGGSPLATQAAVERPGVRVAVQERSGPDTFFSGRLKDAVIVRAPSNPGALEAVKSGKADAMGSIKPILFDLSRQFPGSSVLAGQAGIDPHAMAMPKGRSPGYAYLRQYVDAARADGHIQAAVTRSGLQGVNVAAVR